MVLPKVSIITTCRNAEDVIEDTINSVLNQTYPNIEYVVIDAKSTDKTNDIISKYKKKIDVYISEPDEGIFYGMNKGFGYSSGDIIFFLNAGDTFYDNNVVRNAISYIGFDNKYLGIYGNVKVLNPYRKKDIVRGCEVSPNKLLYRHIHHQSLFVKRELFDNIGLFDTRFKLAADHDWIVRCVKKYPNNFYYANQIVSIYRDGGASCKNMHLMKLEDLTILKENYNVFQYIFGAIVCGVVVLMYKIPQILKLKYATFE